MVATVSGIVKQGLVIPNSPLPEGARVEIVVCETSPEVAPDLQAELDAWDSASAAALELVERSSQEDAAHEER